MLLDEKVVLTRKLWGDGHEKRAVGPNLGVGGLPCLEFGDAVGAPTTAEEVDDDRAKCEEIGGSDEPGSGRVGCEQGGRGGWQSERRCYGTDGANARLDAGGEEVCDGGLGDGEALGLYKGAGLCGDGVEL